MRDCVIWNDWGKCLEIGAETRAEEIYDIVFTDCDIIHVTGTVLDCCNVDYADVHGVVFQHMQVEMDEVIPPPRYQYYDKDPYGEVQPGYIPPVVCSEVAFHHEYSARCAKRGRNRDLRFEDIRIFGDIKPAFSFTGYSEEYGCQDIAIRDVYVNEKLLTDPSEYFLNVGKFCQNIYYDHSKK